MSKPQRSISLSFYARIGSLRCAPDLGAASRGYAQGSDTLVLNVRAAALVQCIKTAGRVRRDRDATRTLDGRMRHVLCYGSVGRKSCHLTRAQRRACLSSEVSSVSNRMRSSVLGDAVAGELVLRAGKLLPPCMTFPYFSAAGTSRSTRSFLGCPQDEDLERESSFWLIFKSAEKPPLIRQTL